jgi:hypothetical protein
VVDVVDGVAAVFDAAVCLAANAGAPKPNAAQNSAAAIFEVICARIALNLPENRDFSVTAE